jgi:hypothetical protein
MASSLLPYYQIENQIKTKKIIVCYINGTIFVALNGILMAAALFFYFQIFEWGIEPVMFFGRHFPFQIE